MFDKKKQDYYTIVKIKGTDHIGTFGKFGKIMFDDISQELKNLFGTKKVIRLYDKNIVNAMNIIVNSKGLLRKATI